jgi:hypothetical protein
MTVPISPVYHQFFSTIYPYKPTQDLLSSISCSTAPLAAWHSSFLGGILERFILRCVASIEHSSASQRVAGTRKAVACSFSFPLLRPVHGRSGQMLHVNLSSAAPLFVFLYCILERPSVNMLSTTFRDPHTYTPTHSLTFIHLRQSSPDKCFCRINLDHVFLHHTIPYYP